MIVNRQRDVPVAIAPLGEFLERARRELHFPKGSVTVRLVSDPAIAALNGRFRGKRSATDVLSFPANANPVDDNGGAEPPPAPSAGLSGENAESYIGDIAISPRTARRNARRMSRGLAMELRVLILHGMIHLAGYDHETDRGEMEKLERRLRRRLGLR